MTTMHFNVQDVLQKAFNRNLKNPTKALRCFIMDFGNCNWLIYFILFFHQLINNNFMKTFLLKIYEEPSLRQKRLTENFLQQH